jgi:hypothetical protein
MSKFFFRYEPNREADSLAQTLSLMFLIPITSIKADDVWESRMNSKRKIESFSITELLTYTICRIKKVPSMTIIEIDDFLTSDEKLIELFKDNYLGAINSKVSKAHLVELANLQSNYNYSEYLEGWMRPHFPGLKDSFLKAGLDEKECKEIEKLFNTSIKPVNDWIKLRNSAIKKNIKPLTKFVIRGF